MGFGDTSAKDKKKAAASSADQASKSAAEDASWDDGAKTKAARAKEKEEKADAKLIAKKEREELEAQENEANSKLKGANKGAASTKVTQAEIARRQALLAMSKAAPKKSAKTEVVAQPKLEANLNRGEDVIEATGIDAALQALDLGGGSAAGEKKLTKVTYQEFESRELPGLKEENPGLKMSQLKERAWKLWERSPENPKNQEK